ncbi:hypothetical protein OB981_28305 [Bacillus cereus]|nr:hypothetical protein [Bacillus cereus]
MLNKVSQDTQRQRKKRNILIILFLFALLCSFTMYTLIGKQSPRVIAGDYLPDEKDSQKIDSKKVVQEKIDASNFTLSIYPKGTFHTNTGKGFLHIRNEPHNAYPINVKIKRDDTQEIIYETGAIYPGHEIKEVTLEKSLEIGEYQATADVDIFNPKSKKSKEQHKQK